MKKVRLSPTQMRVVEHEEGALLVVAGPGSGKTRVLTERVRRLLTEVPVSSSASRSSRESSKRPPSIGVFPKVISLSVDRG